jgi:hypothetical protein
MTSQPSALGGSDKEEFWREYLTVGHARERAARRFVIHLPHEPRCRICAAPFSR